MLCILGNINRTMNFLQCVQVFLYDVKTMFIIFIYINRPSNVLQSFTNKQSSKLYNLKEFVEFGAAGKIAIKHTTVNNY